MRPHIQLGRLADHLLRVKSLEAESLKHLASCSACASDLQWLKDLATLRQFEPPESALETALRHFRKKTDAA